MAQRTIREKRGVSPFLILLVTLIVAAVGAGGYLAWMVWGTTAFARDRAVEEIAQVRTSWEGPLPTELIQEDPEGPPIVGDPRMHEANWLLQIPAFSAEWPIIAGVTETDLNRGVGWYPGTARPGQLGNFALAGNCLTEGEPFRRLLELRQGDEVVVETRTAVFTYQIISAPAELTVDATESWVLNPVPGQSDVVPHQALVTLTTCEDLFPTQDRAVGFGALTATEKKTS
ncbi:MAG: class E sortase [Propionibacteriaceae bacterium]|nr:class E sortase [Propionibacteriaceae bacterium]